MDEHYVRPLALDKIETAVEKKRYAPLLEQPAELCAVCIADFVIDDSRIEVGVGCNLQGMRELPGANDLGAHRFQRFDDVERNERFVLKH